MKFTIPALGLAALATATPVTLDARQQTTGNGPFGPAVRSGPPNSHQDHPN